MLPKRVTHMWFSLCICGTDALHSSVSAYCVRLRRQWIGKVQGSVQIRWSVCETVFTSCSDIFDCGRKESTFPSMCTSRHCSIGACCSSQCAHANWNLLNAFGALGSLLIRSTQEFGIMSSQLKRLSEDYRDWYGRLSFRSPT